MRGREYSNGSVAQAGRSTCDLDRTVGKVATWRVARGIEERTNMNLSDYTSPEDRLMLAVLQDALAIFQRGMYSRAPNAREKYREVDKWIRSDECDSPFSFEAICSTLQIDPDCLRASLERARRLAYQSEISRRAGEAPRARIHARRAGRGGVG
jgi:hypothetical protein